MSKDPYRYFRIEARELLEGMQRGLAALEGPERTADTVPLLLRLAHTLKGAARVVRLTAVANHTHQFEEVLAPLRESAAPPAAEQAAELRRLLAAIAAGLAAIDQPAPAPSSAGEAPAPATPAPLALDTVRLQVAEVDAVLARVADTMGELAALRADFRDFEPVRRQSQLIRALAGRGRLNAAGQETAARLQADADDLSSQLEKVRRRAGSRVERIGRDLERLHEQTGGLRLLPTDALWTFLDRAVRDAAQTLGRSARLETHCRVPRIDAPVFAGLQEALLHLARNAVAHGIEPEAARRAAGKPAEGLIEIRVEPGIGRLRVTCRDDGAGINLDAVRRAAAAKGGRPGDTAAPMGMDEAIQFLLRGGVSTAPVAGAISGRGVGLDAVRAAAQRLGGELTLASTPQRGTEAVLDVPMALAAIEALAVESSGTHFLLPLEAVQRVARLENSAIEKAGEREELRTDQEAMPFAPLHRLTAPSEAGPRPSRRHVTVVILHGAGGRAALGVDRLLGVTEAVIRPLPVLADAQHVAGVSLDANGLPRLMLEPRALAAAIGDARAEARPTASARPPILVVDDSLTTRMLEQSILESAGYAVDTAVSGEDGLARLREKAYGLMLVDLEMPGMNGFEVIETLRRDPALRALPAILVTSRESREDRQRGLAAGAQDYFVKGDFDQRRLLQRIAELLA